MKYSSFLLVAISVVLLQLPAAAQDNNLTAEQIDRRVVELNTLKPEAYVADDLKYEVEWPKAIPSNILWARRVWRIIDTREKENRLLCNYISKPASLAEVLVAGALDGRYKAFGGADPRLNYGLGMDSLRSLLSPGRAGEGQLFDAAGCSKYLLREDWLYLAAEKKLVVRNFALAPLQEVHLPDGSTKDEPLFWLYYTGIRPYLREQEISDPIDGNVQNLDHVFETRQFAGAIDSAQKIVYPSTRPFCGCESPKTSPAHQN
jgi:hypothetical protein